MNYLEIFVIALFATGAIFMFYLHYQIIEQNIPDQISDAIKIIFKNHMQNLEHIDKEITRSKSELIAKNDELYNSLNLRVENVERVNTQVSEILQLLRENNERLQFENDVLHRELKKKSHLLNQSKKRLSNGKNRITQ